MTGAESAWTEKLDFGKTTALGYLQGLPSWFKIAQHLHEMPTWARYVLATALVFLTTLLRYAFLPNAFEYIFIFFFPAILISSLFLSRGSGLWTVLLSAISIKAVLIAPPSLLAVSDREELLGFALFFGTGLVTALTAEALHNAFFRLAKVNAELRAAHVKISASEHDKDLLLHELTHRFRNDLANLTSLLRLQARSASDPATCSELMEASNRVHVVGRVHQRLSPFSGAAVIDLRSFILDLCEDLRLALIRDQHIVLQAESAEIQMPFTQAVTIGMVTNELVTNARKYAFPDCRHGTIKVQITCFGDWCCLMVADDGVGQCQQVSDSSGLGQRLIQSMAQQLGGNFTADVRDSGRTCTLRFPLAPIAKSNADLVGR